MERAVRRRSRGFTLVEMLVALAVASLLVSLVYGAVRVGQRSASALDRQVAQSEVMRIGWQFIHDAVSHAVPALDPARPASRNGFEGGADRLVFVAKMTSYVGTDGLMRISLGREAAGDGDQLLLTRVRLDGEDAAADGEAIEQAVLVDRLGEFRVEYFGQVERGTAPDWHAFWDNPGQLPNLVRIQVGPADGAPWPVLIAAPQDGTAPLDDSVLPGDGDEAEPPEQVRE
jgi:general secretion pathway protein J